MARTMKIILLIVALATPVPILKEGSCPPGYSTSGNYCTPNSSAHSVIRKSGACPPGWSTSGNYCVQN